MDLENCKIVEVGRLSVPRSSHALVSLPNGIGVIGGYTNNQVVID